jgi:hypothetical protein
MPISSILGSAAVGVASAVGGAAKAGGNAFADLFERARGATTSEANSATTGANVGELTRDAENQLSEFKRAIQQLFSSAGIDTSWEIRLQSDGQGGVQVNADHPDGEKIEQLLRENPDLIEKFDQVQDAYARLRSSSGEAKPSDELLAPAFSIVFADNAARVVFA